MCRAKAGGSTPFSTTVSPRVGYCRYHLRADDAGNRSRATTVTAEISPSRGSCRRGAFGPPCVSRLFGTLSGPSLSPSPASSSPTTTSPPDRDVAKRRRFVNRGRDWTVAGGMPLRIRLPRRAAPSVQIEHRRPHRERPADPQAIYSAGPSARQPLGLRPHTPPGVPFRRFRLAVD